MQRALRVSAFLLATTFATLLHAQSKQACVDAHTAAQELRQAGKLKAAREKLVLCGQSSCPTVARDDCTKWLSDIDKTLPTVLLDVRDDKGNAVPSAHLTIDGIEPSAPFAGPLSLDPGTHTFRAENAGYSPIERVDILRAGELNHPIALTFGTPLEPSPALAPDHPVPPLVYLLGAVGVVGIASFSYFALSGKSGQSALESCKPQCSQTDVDTVRSKYLVANVSGAVGLVALGAATLLFLTRAPTNDPTQSTISFDLEAVPKSASFRTTATF